MSSSPFWIFSTNTDSIFSAFQACGTWEAVKTITSDPEMVKKLANAKKSRKRFEHEDVSRLEKLPVRKSVSDIFFCQ